MGTRGTVTLVANGKKVRWYVHSDAHSAWLGARIVASINELLARFTIEQLIAMVTTMRAVTDGLQPTAQQLLFLEPFVDTTVSSRNTDDWYCLLRRTQWYPHLVLIAGVYIPHDGDEARNYVLDLGARTFACAEIGAGKVAIGSGIAENWREVMKESE